jgi:hypothetical protein
MTGNLERISEGSGRGIFEIQSGNLPGETEESLRIIGVPAEIGIKNL